jgi:hypothetical protein
MYPNRFGLPGWVLVESLGKPARRPLFALAAVLLLSAVLLASLDIAQRDAPASPTSGTAGAQEGARTGTAVEAQEFLTQGPTGLRFEVNGGQAPDDVRFVAQGLPYALHVTADAIRIIVEREERAVELRFPALAEPVGEAPAASRTHLYLGQDPSAWTSVAHYERIHWHGAGIEVVLRSDGAGAIEFDHILAPGTPVAAATFTVVGHDALRLVDGALEIVVGEQVLPLRAPVVYQERAGERILIDSAYEMAADRIGYRVGSYDARLPLVIDPVLDHGTYIGALGSWASSVAVQEEVGGIRHEFAHVAGWATPPTPAIYYPTGFPPTASHIHSGASTPARDTGFIAKYDYDAKTRVITPVWYAYIGGSGADRLHSIAVDHELNVHVVGETRSVDYPTRMPLTHTPDSFNGGVMSGDLDAVVSVLDSAGALLFSSYLGGDGEEAAYGVAVNTDKHTFVVGYTKSGRVGTSGAHFPRVNAFQPAPGPGTEADGFVAHIDAFAATPYLRASSYLGGGQRDEARAVALHPTAVFVAGTTWGGSLATFPTTVGAFQTRGVGGSEAFVARLDVNATLVTWASLYGGSGDDAGLTLDVDLYRRAWLGGGTMSNNLKVCTAVCAMTPIQAMAIGGEDGFVAAFNELGTGLVYGTYLGGTGADTVTSLAWDDRWEHVVATGRTFGAGFPLVAPLFSVTAGEEAFVIRFKPGDGTPIFATTMGATGRDLAQGIAIDRHRNIYIAGVCDSCTLRTMAPVQATASGFPSATFSIIGKTPPTAVLRVSSPGFGTNTTPPASAHEVAVEVPIHINGSSSLRGDLPISTHSWELLIGTYIDDSDTGSAVPDFSPFSSDEATFRDLCLDVFDADPNSPYGRDRVCIRLNIWDPSPPDPPGCPPNCAPPPKCPPTCQPEPCKLLGQSSGDANVVASVDGKDCPGNSINDGQNEKTESGEGGEGEGAGGVGERDERCSVATPEFCPVANVPVITPQPAGPCTPAKPGNVTAKRVGDGAELRWSKDGTCSVDVWLVLVDGRSQILAQAPGTALMQGIDSAPVQAHRYLVQAVAPGEAKSLDLGKAVPSNALGALGEPAPDAPLASEEATLHKPAAPFPWLLVGIIAAVALLAVVFLVMRRRRDES